MIRSVNVRYFSWVNFYFRFYKHVGRYSLSRVVFLPIRHRDDTKAGEGGLTWSRITLDKFFGAFHLPLLLNLPYFRGAAVR
jgi:hypothetical protein